MKTNELSTDPPIRSDELPTFDLTYLTDSDDDPTEVTLFPADGENFISKWITIDIDHSIPLEEVA